MRPLIFDATPLIYLTKAGLARVLETLPAQKFVTRSVFKEAVEIGENKGYADALAIARLFEMKTLAIAEPSVAGIFRTLTKVRGLELADIETLAVAKEREYTAVVDDLLARKVARTYGIDLNGTATIVFMAVQTGLIGKQEGSAIDAMIEAGWRCGPELYGEITRILQRL